MKKTFITYLIISALAILTLCGCKGGGEKINSVSPEVTKNTTVSYETVSIDTNTTSDEALQHENPPAEYVVEDRGQFDFEKIEVHLANCPELDTKDLSESVSKKEIESFDDACEYAKDILAKGRQVYSGWHWEDYIVRCILRDDENKLWAAYLMTPFNKNDDVIIIGGNHVTVFDDYGEIIGVWYEGS